MSLSKRNMIICATVAMLLFAPNALAQRNDLKLGDQAPGLDIEQWLGPEVSIQNGYTYLVLFFSTEDTRIEQWFNVLSKLYNSSQSEGLQVMAISDEEADVVENFVRRLGDWASFSVAVDRRGATNRNWIGASEIESTPAMFLVDKRGFIQFMGDPSHKDFEETYELVLYRRYDAKLYKEAEPAIQAMKTARKMRNWRMCLKYFDELIETDNYAFAPMVIDKFEVMLVDMDQKDGAYEYAQQAMAQYASDPELLMWFAEFIIEDSIIPDGKRDLDVALAMVEQAAPQIDANDPDRYAMLAKVHFHRGEYRDAVSLQQKAYLTSPPLRKDQFEKVLKTYMEEARRK